ncbi:MAG: gamma carbonic anhydrase family protein [Helicobacteraceae bacterium]|jgi:carbonic anhydrase/acetyltransferase-like protein (isoleucine patch superfamily)|nr:gamma carbonic anhydrase family protein [Helicobacteraceae bacterium]
MIAAFQTWQPAFDEGVFIAASADVIGRASIGRDSSVWFNAVVRADVNVVTIGERSSVQDGAIVHVTHEDEHGGGFACVIGNDVTIGHGAILHGCEVKDACLIGMGAVILDGAVIESESIVGACALVTQGKRFPRRSLIIGSPARAVRTLDDAEVEELYASARRYVVYKNGYLEQSAVG